MKIELLEILAFEEKRIKLDIDIAETSTISELFDEIHKITGKPKLTTLKWGDHEEQIGCRYYVNISKTHVEIVSIDDLNELICDFPKNGTNGELSVYFDTESHGLVN